MRVAKTEYPDGRVTVLTLRGEFDAFVTNPFNDEIDKIVEAGNSRLVLNMRLVKFINSTALGSMIRARKLCQTQGGDVVLSQPSVTVREAMETLGLLKLFRVFPGDAEAATELAESDGEPEASEDG